MPDVFEDTVGTFDLTITTSADWTVSSGGLPNGDNYVSGDGTIAATYNANGDEFDFADGTAWTVEFWFYYTTTTIVDQIIMQNAIPSGGGANPTWTVYWTSAEDIALEIINTTNAVYLGTSVPVATMTASAWHHVVFIKQTGNTVKAYVDNVLRASSSSTSGTARAPGATHELFFGTDSLGASDLGASSSGVRISKLAIYNLELSTDQINDHYLAMVAS